MPTWPASLPQIALAGSWTNTPQDNLARFQPDVGPEIVRRRATSKVEKYTATLEPINETQLATFKTFFATTLFDGALSFDWTDPDTDTTASWRIKNYTVEGIGGGRNTVTLELDKLP